MAELVDFLSLEIDRLVMRGSFYPEVFARRSVTVRAPGDDDVAYVHEKYVTELIPGTYLPETSPECCG